MALPSYPTYIGIQIGYRLAPGAASARVSFAPNGRAHVQHLGVYDDIQVDVVHPLIDEAELEELRRFFEANRNQQFLFIDKAGRAYLGQFTAKPTEKHERLSYWTVTSRLILQRMDQ